MGRVGVGRPATVGRRRLRCEGAAVVVATALFSLAGCSPADETLDPSPRPPAATAVPATPSPSPSASTAPGLEALFEPVRGFRFDPVSATLQKGLEQRLRPVFGGLEDVQIAVRAVVTPDGASVPVRLAAVSYELPEGATIEQFAYELGREFLGSNPQNSRGTLGGNGIYMHEPGESTESVAFFVSEGVFIYAFGATVEAPTEIVSRRVFRAACGRIDCEV
ncbi:MAG: hypothetical protein ABR613_13530 [Actinomycetota bacterium]